MKWYFTASAASVLRVLTLRFCPAHEPWKKGPTWLRWFMHVGNEQIPPPVMYTYIYIWMYLDDILRWWTEIPWKMETLFFPDRKHGKPKMSQSRPLPHGAERDLANNLPPILVWMKCFLTILEAAFWNLRFFLGGGGNPSFSRLVLSWFWRTWHGSDPTKVWQST